LGIVFREIVIYIMILHQVHIATFHILSQIVFHQLQVGLSTQLIIINTLSTPPIQKQKILQVLRHQVLVQVVLVVQVVRHLLVQAVIPVVSRLVAVVHHSQVRVAQVRLAPLVVRHHSVVAHAQAVSHRVAHLLVRKM